MSKKICIKLKEGEKTIQYENPKYLCKTCSAESEKEKEICKPKKMKRA